MFKGLSLKKQASVVAIPHKESILSELFTLSIQTKNHSAAMFIAMKLSPKFDYLIRALEAAGRTLEAQAVRSVLGNPNI